MLAVKLFKNLDFFREETSTRNKWKTFLFILSSCRYHTHHHLRIFGMSLLLIYNKKLFPSFFHTTLLITFSSCANIRTHIHTKAKNGIIDFFAVFSEQYHHVYSNEVVYDVGNWQHSFA